MPKILPFRVRDEVRHERDEFPQRADAWRPRAHDVRLALVRTYMTLPGRSGRSSAGFWRPGLRRRPGAPRAAAPRPSRQDPASPRLRRRNRDPPSRTPGARPNWSADLSEGRYPHREAQPFRSQPRVIGGLRATAGRPDGPPPRPRTPCRQSRGRRGPPPRYSDSGDGPSGAFSAIETMRVASSPTICS